MGRAPELAALERALDEAARGRPALVLLAGESGVGKTRLLDEVLVRSSPVHVLRGDCLELDDAELPFMAVVSALRPVVRDRVPGLDELTSGQRRALATLLPGLDRPADEPAEDDAEDGAQGRLFEALLALLDRLGRDAPVVFAVEDVHWADRSTRAFLAFLARNLDSERVLVVATYRTDELHRRHPLRPLLAELERDQRVRRVELRPLAREDLALALEDILGHAPHRGLLDRVYARSEGNPLFVEELLAASPDARAELPASLRDALILRIERLSDDAQDTLRLIALAERADHALLAAASPLSAARLRGVLRETVEHNLVVADEHGRHRFRHALLREVVAADVLPGERVEMHLSLARALQLRQQSGEGGPQVLAGIAHHLRAAGDRPAALVATVRAGQAARSVHAHGEAASSFDHALKLFEQVPDAEAVAGCDHAELLTWAADAHYLGGDRRRTEAWLRAALAEVDHGQDPERAAALLQRMARTERSLNRTEEAVETARRGLRLLASRPLGARAGLLAFVAKTRTLQGRYGDAAEAAREAIEAAEAGGYGRAKVTALESLGLAEVVTGRPEPGFAHLREAIEVARADGRLDAMAWVYLNLADSLHLQGRSDEALRVIEEARSDEAPPSHKRWLKVLVAEIEIDRGNWDEAEAHLPSRHRLVVGNERLNVTLRQVDLALGRGDHAAAEDMLTRLDAAVAENAESQFVGVHGALLAELRRRQGDLEAARAAVDEALERLEPSGDDAVRLARVAVAGLVVEADAALRARDLGDEREATASEARADGLLAFLERAAQGGGPVEQARLASGRAERARASNADAAGAYRAAAERWEALGRPYETALARYRQAEAHGRAGRREDATRAAADALDAARSLGAAWLTREIEGLVARGRLRLAGTERESAPAHGADHFGLTRRERQVLTLLARGATNRQIGAELYIAEKTASVHVSRILTKLDVRRRTEAAAVAYRLGLVDRELEG